MRVKCRYLSSTGLTITQLHPLRYFEYTFTSFSIKVSLECSIVLVSIRQTQELLAISFGLQQPDILPS